MKTQEQVEKKIEELKNKKYEYEMNGGGWVNRPYPYDALIKLLEWTMEE